MTSPDRPENQNHPEQVTLKDARVAFYGMVHSPFNLQGIKPAVDCFEQLLTKSSGRNVLYKESATFTPEVARTSKIVVQHHGLVDPLLGDILRAHRVSTITQATLDQLRQTIEQVGFRAIEMGLVPPTTGQDFFLSLEMEKLRRHLPFNPEYEFHSEGKVREISAHLAKVQALEGENINFWMRGEVGRIVRNKKQSHQTTQSIWTDLRKADIVRDLGKITRSLAHDKHNGVLFIMFGGTHTDVVEEIQDAVSKEGQIGFEVIISSLPQSPESIIQEALQSGKEAPDDVYAQHFLDTVMTATVNSFAMSKRRLTSYAENYETVAKTISAIATSFSLAEIEGFAKSRRDLLDVLRAHPLSAPLLPYISRLLI